MLKNNLSFEELRDFLNQKTDQYNHPEFVETDPIQIPKFFSEKEDIEISGFLAATIAWGQRKTIIKNAKRIMDLLGNSPYDFIMSYKPSDLIPLQSFVHRTFNGQDLTEFIHSLRKIYLQFGSLEEAVYQCIENNNLQKGISNFKQLFFKETQSIRTLKHLSDPEKGSAAKRINMYFRWLVRHDNKGVDLGIWKRITPSQLSCPLDVHSGNVARCLGLITRKQNDAKSLAELDKNLRLFDANDPAKYDFALFGLGIFEDFCKRKEF
ncbi:TIGR02757 family protein [Capnocytophaga catalasegens]|uniref:TIGR02757 family protein n=1 Tax=Capnocytophaga catalasegens TaxID=1004260 RepID=A0AAV5AU97_9FLAO|nr:TIGR02757 family protein [Capnocytophaga catalasegens]GJM49073.1 TIGR02757 family protein [Capnocytophaga catalasegens]GJM52334.1 TIGR02757 family protein [Capnocytophaga catalasegens]